MMAGIQGQSLRELAGLDIRWCSTWLGRARVDSISPTGLIVAGGVEGYLCAGDIAYIAEVCDSLPHCAMCCEIGSYKGLSAIAWASCLEATGRSDASILAVDTFPKKGSEEAEQDLFEQFSKNVSAAGYSGMIRGIRLDSVSAASACPDGFLDAVFIDGDHSYDGCLADLWHWYPKLSPTGRFFGHDAVAHIKPL